MANILIPIQVFSDDCIKWTRLYNGQRYTRIQFAIEDVTQGNAPIRFQPTKPRSWLTRLWELLK